VDLKRDRLLWLGLAAIAAGFVSLGLAESTVLAPVLLVGGYCVLIPAYLWKRYRRDVGE
jgi:hypothetical protein